MPKIFIYVCWTCICSIYICIAQGCAEKTKLSDFLPIGDYGEPICYYTCDMYAMRCGFKCAQSNGVYR